MSQFRPEWILLTSVGCATLLLAGCGEEGMDASPSSGIGPPPIQAPVTPAPTGPAPIPFIEERPRTLASPPPGFYARFVCLDGSGYGSLRSYVLADGSIWTSYGSPFCIYGPGWYEDSVSGFWQGHLDYAGAKSASDARIFGLAPVAEATLEIGHGGEPAKLYSDLQLAGGGDQILVGAAASEERYVQQRPADLAAEVGAWYSLAFLADGLADYGNVPPSLNVNVSHDGTVRAHLKAGCSATGKIAPHRW